MSSTGIQIRPFSANDISFAMELKNLTGWNQTEDDWRSYLYYQREGCFLAQTNGERAGTATAITYEDRFGWVGMVLVHPTKRRLGIGTELLKEAIEYIQQAGADCVKLDATHMGKKVYIPLGFVEEYELQRYQAIVANDTIGSIDNSSGYSPEIHPISVELMEEIVSFDGHYFGSPRGKVLYQLSQRNPEYSFCMKDHSGMTGYIMAHQGYEAVQIGPWVAKDADTAEQLFTLVLDRLTGGQKVFIDVPCPNEEAIRLMKKYKFNVQRTFCRMFLGENKYPGQPECIYGTSGAEKG